MIDSFSPQTHDRTPLEEFESALAWWREAGVDSDFADVPRNWLAEAETGPAVAPSPAPPPPAPPKRTPLQRAIEAPPEGGRIGGPRSSWPRDLAAFGEWWMQEKSLSDAGIARRAPPRGLPDAQLMVLTGAPIEDETTNRLLAAILRAMGIGEHESYLSSAMPAVAALPDWNELARRGLGAVTAHHVALARPLRVIAFGRELAPLFGMAPEKAREPAALGDTPLLLAPDFTQLARSPARRRNFWIRWLDWTR